METGNQTDVGNQPVKGRTQRTSQWAEWRQKTIEFEVGIEHVVEEREAEKRKVKWMEAWNLTAEMRDAGNQIVEGIDEWNHTVE